MAQRAGGTFLLRIEDIDQSRARDEWEDQIYDDLTWLGISWEEPVMRQSERGTVYRETLQQKWWDRLLYACTCNRRDVIDAASAPQEGALTYGPDGIIYPGTCRNELSDRDHYPAPPPARDALRLDWSTFPVGVFDGLRFVETGSGQSEQFDVHRQALIETVGDIVIARKDMGTSYHLSVVLDDAAQGVTHVVRGEDLFDATKIHVALQAGLGLPTPIYHHHRLIRDDNGKRLAKRDDACALSKYRQDGASPDDIRGMVGLSPSSA